MRYASDNLYYISFLCTLHFGITLIYGAELIVKICSHVNGFSHGAKLYVKTHSHGAKLYVKNNLHGTNLSVNIKLDT